MRDSRLRQLILAGLSACLLAGCSLWPGATFWTRETDTVRRLVILYTNDEHGWMEPWSESSGAAGLYHKWRRYPGFEEGGPYLVLSGGDMWTGPAISTTLEGRSMADIMNRMGYDAAAIGNHDFDFGLEALRARAQQSQFPLLSANLRERSSGEIPDFAAPYTILEVNGIRVGIIGLTTVETRVDTPTYHVQGLRFLRYGDVLDQVIPEVKSQGTDLVLLIGHLCNGDLRRIADYGAKYDLPLMAGGHCHEEHNEEVEGVYLIESGYFLRGYVEAEIYVDTARDQVVAMDTTIHHNDGGRADEAIAERVEYWRGQTDAALWEPIGYAAREINRRSAAMDHLLTEAWLRAVPQADVAIASRRYVQQSIEAGDITAGTIVGILPVSNVLMKARLTGQELETTIRSRDPVMGGVRWQEDRLVLADGTPLEAEREYVVLIPDVIYYGANYYEVQSMDPEAVELDIDWRDPVVDYVLSLDSSQDRPLDALLDGG